MTKRKSLIIWTIFVSILIGCKKDPPATPDPNASLKEGLLVYLPFNESLNDASGNNQSVSPGAGGLSYTGNRFFEEGKALLLSGNNTWVEISEQKIAGLKKFTFYMEFYPTSIDAQCLIGKRTYSPSAENPLSQAFNILMHYDNQPVRFTLRKTRECNSESLSAYHDPLSSGVAHPMLDCWNYVAGTFDGSVQKLYLNGKLVAQQNLGGVEMCSGDPVRLGVWWKNDPLFFSGKIDEVRIYNRALTEEEVHKLFKLSS